MAKLDEGDLQFLLNIVEDTSSDYDDELEGFTSYEVRRDDSAGPVLKVSFQDEGLSQTIKARWALTLIDSEMVQS